MIKFKLVISKNFPKVLIGDFENVLRIIIHLLSNAYKYTEEGSITMNLIIKDNEFTISVKDTGVGIKEEDINRLFTKFERPDFEYHQSDKRGVGLGLSIVKQLAELMNGSVNVSSIYGQGSTFTVIIKQKVVNLKDEV